MAPSYKLELARIAAELRIQDGARVWQKSIWSGVAATYIGAAASYIGAAATYIGTAATYIGAAATYMFLQKILPLRGSILQVETCQIFSLAENPRWSRVWQYCSAWA